MACIDRVSITALIYRVEAGVLWYVKNRMISCGENHIYSARVAEWSKAPDSSSGGRESAWVQIPPRAVVLFIVYPMPKVIIKVFMLRICTSTHLG